MPWMLSGVTTALPPLLGVPWRPKPSVVLGCTLAGSPQETLNLLSPHVKPGDVSNSFWGQTLSLLWQVLASAHTPPGGLPSPTAVL